MVSEDEWNQWAASPVTKLFIGHLKEAQNQAVERLLNIDVGLTRENLDSYAIRCLSLRFFIDGMAQASDLETIADSLVEKEEEVIHGY